MRAFPLPVAAEAEKELEAGNAWGTEDVCWCWMSGEVSVAIGAGDSGVGCEVAGLVCTLLLPLLLPLLLYPPFALL